MGTLVDELERNNTIENAKIFLKNGVDEDVVIKSLADGLDISLEEAKKLFEEEVK